MHDLSPLQNALGISFNNQELLQQALVHRSYLNENPSFQLPHNERLEFLGDAVLELVVTEYLYKAYPNPEGELTNWRASLVNSATLAECAREAGLAEYLYLSHGESRDQNTKARNYILANAMEALIGAIYLDQGYDAAKKIITARIISKLPNILEHKLYRDPKTAFQEAAQEKLSLTPTYHVVSESGPDHNKQFTIAVRLGDHEVAQGTGTSKQEAETAAAQAGLETKGW